MVTLFLGEGFRQKGRTNQGVGNQTYAQIEIRPEKIGGDGERVVPETAPNAAAHGFNGFCDRLRTAVLGVFDQQSGREPGDAVVGGGLTEQAAPENGMHRRQGQALVLVHEERQPIVERDLADVIRPKAGARRGATVPVPRGSRETSVRWSSTR
ncbi:MAG: hypothetical protein R3F31_20610 [Verrucomicrobiales bacterium]